MREHLPTRAIAGLRDKSAHAKLWLQGQAFADIDNNRDACDHKDEKLRPEIVKVTIANGCEVPALTLVPGLMEPLQEALKVLLARRTINNERKDYDAYLDSLAERLRKQVYQLDETLTDTLHFVLGGETAEAIRDRQYGLLRDLASIDERKQEVKDLEEDLEHKQLYPSQDPLRSISDVLTKYGLLDIDESPPFPDSPPFDLRLLKHMETHGSMAHLCQEVDFSDTEGTSDVGSFETDLERPDTEPISDDVFEAEEQLYQIYKTMIEERAEVRRLADEIDAQRGNDVDAEPTIIQRALHIHPQGRRDRLEVCWDRIDNLRSRVKASDQDWPLHDKVLEDEEVVRECGWWGQKLSDLSSEAEGLRKRKQSEKIAARLSWVEPKIDIALRKYKYLRTQCHRRGVDHCPHRGLSGQEIIDLVFDQNVAADRAVYEARQALQAEILARKSGDTDSDKRPRGAYLKHLHRDVATKRRILYEARMELENYTDERIWASFGGMCDDSDDETRSDASETSGYGHGPLPAQTDLIKSLPGLAARSTEPIWQRWRHCLGPFGRKSSPPPTEVASIPKAGSDSVSVRHPEEEGLDGKTDQSLMQRWQYISARNGRDVAKPQISTLDLSDMFGEGFVDPESNGRAP